MEERSDKGFRKLIVWQRAHQLALLVYKLTEKFPKGEIYGKCGERRCQSLQILLKDMAMEARDKLVVF